MSVQVDPMAASVVAAALSGTYPTLLPQWCLPPREAPLVGVQTHQDSGAAADQPLDLSAKPRNSQVSSRPFILPRGNAWSFSASSLFLQRSFEFIRTLSSRQERYIARFAKCSMKNHIMSEGDCKRCKLSATIIHTF